MTSGLQNNERLQDNGNGWLTSGLYDGYFVNPAGGQLFDGVGNATEWYFLNANLFTRQEPGFGDEFHLSPVSGQYTTARSGADPSNPGCVLVPWQHIVQHLYSHFTDMDIKEAHTFWPPSMTEAQLLDTLVTELNAEGSTDASIVWIDDNTIKTFFLNAPRNLGDKYSGDQLEDVMSLLG